MLDAVHLLIPFAAADGDAARAALAGLSLPHLERLLARLQPHTAADPAPASALSMPHERALADAIGLPGADGQLPWAAWEHAHRGGAAGTQAWAWITPSHWLVGRDHVRMADPRQLDLSAEDSQALLGAMRPYFEEDGLQLQWERPDRWLACGPLFAGLPLASLDRVAGRVLDAWMPRSPAARPLRRLQQEMQMLLYTHPVNEARSAAGLLPVNSFWASGAGALPDGAVPVQPDGLLVPQALREAALRADWPAWAAAWQQLDATACADALRALAAGQTVTLTLCGERQACRWTSDGAGWSRKLTALWSRPRAATVLETL